MSYEFTQTIDQARLLLSVFQKQGPGVFRETLWEHTELIFAATRGDPQSINGRFMTILSSMLSILYVNNMDSIIRKNVLLSQGFINAPDLDLKRERFVEDLLAFLMDYEDGTQQNEFSGRVIFYLKTCSLEELKRASIESLADHFKFSRNYFADKFRKEQNHTIHDALTNEKLNRALILMRTHGSMIPVKQLSQMLGFSDSVYFSRLFKKAFGFSPSGINRPGE